MNSHWKTFNIRIRINEAEVGDGESWIMCEMAAGAEEHIIIKEAYAVPTDDDDFDICDASADNDCGEH